MNPMGRQFLRSVNIILFLTSIILDERKWFFILLLIEENNDIFKKLTYRNNWQKTLKRVVCDD